MPLSTLSIGLPKKVKVSIINELVNIDDFELIIPSIPINIS
jgi:hypothetical protein